MDDKEKDFGGSDLDFGKGKSLLSILLEAATYGSPVSVDMSPRFSDRRTVATQSIEIGDGLHIKVNGLKNWSIETD